MKHGNIIWLILFLLQGCIEEVDLGVGDGTLPSVLIVEATLTNELKHHQVVLSNLDSINDLEIDSIFNPFLVNTNRNMDRDLINYETGAQVAIVDGSGQSFDFIELDPGRYQSSIEFAAEQNNSYTLRITTADNRNFESTPMAIQGESEIQNLYAERMVSDTGGEGVGIFLDNISVGGNSRNVRFNYEETYKIIAPMWSSREFSLTNYQPCAPDNGFLALYDLEIIPRQQEERVCFRTDVSNGIILGNSGIQQSGDLKKQMVRFIDSDNFIISHRYSILVEQYVVGLASFSFYEQLNSFSETGSLFSQIQPGFLQGNITESNGTTDSVIGFFDIASVSKKRLFFNYTDLYPNEPLPPFPFECEPLSAEEGHISFCHVPPEPRDIINPCPRSVVEGIDQGAIVYYDNNSEGLIGDIFCLSDHAFVVTPCGDCTSMGSNVVPEFWMEE